MPVILTTDEERCLDARAMGWGEGAATHWKSWHAERRKKVKRSPRDAHRLILIATARLARCGLSFLCPVVREAWSSPKFSLKNHALG